MKKSRRVTEQAEHPEKLGPIQVLVYPDVLSFTYDVIVTLFVMFHLPRKGPSRSLFQRAR